MARTYPEVTIDLDRLPISLRADSWRVSIRPTDNLLVATDIPVRRDAKLRWSELDGLRQLIEIRYIGEDVGIVKYVAARAGIRELAWHKHNQSLIDLSSTALAKVVIECDAEPLTLRLPSSGTTKQLTVHAAGDLSNLCVEAPNHGDGIDLTIWYVDKPGTPAMVRGLERIRALRVWHAAKVDLGSFAGCPEIETLDIRDPQGSIENLATLSRFAMLKSLRIKDCYELAIDEIPLPAELKKLESIAFDGIRADDAKKISERLKGFKGLSIRGKRTEAWMRKNFGNPFFAWSSEYGAEMGSKACRIFNSASAAIDKLDTSATAAQVQAIMKKFVESFNRMEIDTVMREQIADAFEVLMQLKPRVVSKQVSSKWFKAWRDF